MSVRHKSNRNEKELYGKYKTLLKNIKEGQNFKEEICTWIGRLSIYDTPFHIYL